MAGNCRKWNYSLFGRVCAVFRRLVQNAEPRHVNSCNNGNGSTLVNYSIARDNKKLLNVEKDVDGADCVSNQHCSVSQMILGG